MNVLELIGAGFVAACGAIIVLSVLCQARRGMRVRAARRAVVRQARVDAAAGRVRIGHRNDMRATRDPATGQLVVEMSSEPLWQPLRDTRDV